MVRVGGPTSWRRRRHVYFGPASDDSIRANPNGWAGCPAPSGQDSHVDTTNAINEAFNVLRGVSVAYDTIRAYANPILTPVSEVTGSDCKGVYAVAVLMDPARATTASLSFGDGTNTSMSVPQGTGLFSTAALSHTFPPNLTGRTISYTQNATLVQTGQSSAGVTEHPPPFSCTGQCSPPPSAISSPTPETGGRWGERIVAANADFNGDGRPDVWVADPAATVNGLPQAGKVYLISGASLITANSTPTTPVVLYTLIAPTPVAYQHYGFVIANIGDVNGDGQPDLAVGVDATTSTYAYTGNGNVWVYDGVAGALLYTINNPLPAASGDRFGSSIGKAGDIYNTASAGFVDPTVPVTGDGKSEIIVGASNAASGAAAAYIFDGNPAAYPPPSNSSSTALRTFAAPNGGSFGLSVQGPGDFNGDGVPDQVISAPAETVGGNATAGAMYVYSGKDQSLLQTIHDPVPQAGSFFGFQDVTPNSPGDVNTDGKADIYAEGWKQDVTVGGVTTTHQGEAWVFPGTATVQTTNTPMYTIDDSHPHTGGQFGWSMTDTLLGSSTTKVLLIGASPLDGATTNEDGGAYLYNSSNGTRNTELSLPYGYEQGTATGNAGPNLGWTVAAPGPLKASPSTDQTYLAGAPFVDDTNSSPTAHQDEGLIFSFWDNNGSYSHPYCEANSNGSPIVPQPAGCT